jgi:protein-L-isoaspartate(D-aspartate) O-methyltransferase
MVIPVGSEKQQKMLRVTKLPDGTPEIETFHDFVFVPLLGKQGW